MRAVLSGLQQYIWLTESPTLLSHLALEELIPSVESKLKMEHPGVEISISFSGLPIIEADTGQMEFVFHELLSNAIRFRKQDGPLQVEISSHPVLQNQFRNLENKYKYADFWKVEIKDNGKGFSTEYAEQLFGLFKKLHPESGRGIGLALCKKVMDNHGGNISIRSSTKTGTTVTLLIPAHPSIKLV
jgi:signal transduction histidine kinase